MPRRSFERRRADDVDLIPAPATARQAIQNSMQKFWYVYLLGSESGGEHFYVGITEERALQNITPAKFPTPPNFGRGGSKVPSLSPIKIVPQHLSGI
jgi:hypothetical protein